MARPPRKQSRIAGCLIRILVLIIVLFIGVILLGAASQKLGEMQDAANYPPPGQMVDVGGFQMHIHCEGEGSPTVIMEHGLGNTSLVWHTVKPAIAAETRTCTFDRAGYGWSEPGPSPRTHYQAVGEIHRMLAAAGISGPFIYVGHSYGGLDAALYAGLYPAEVAGLVLIDPAAPDSYSRFAAYRDIQDAQIGMFDMCAMWMPLGVVRTFQFIGSPDGLPEEMQPQGDALYYRAQFCETARRELQNQTEPVALMPLGRLPLILLSRAVPLDLTQISDRYTAADSAEFERLWQEAQAGYLALSGSAMQITATASGHNIHLDQPQLVIDAIRSMIAAVRGG